MTASGPAAADRSADAARADLAGRVVLDRSAPGVDRGQRFGESALALAVGHYWAALEVREAELAAIEAELAPWAAREPLAGPVEARKTKPAQAGDHRAPAAAVAADARSGVTTVDTPRQMPTTKPEPSTTPR
jgi:hypothetical protein